MANEPSTRFYGRRTILNFLVGGGAALTVACRGAAADVANLGPEAFGAKGDGQTDDTAALQRCIDAAGQGGGVTLRTGAIYRVDTSWQPTVGNYGGLKLRANQTLDLNGAELRALPSSHPEGVVVQAYDVDGWNIVGPGKITGERHAHRGSAGEWGMGVVAWSASGWSIRGNVEISQCWGDGIMVSYAPAMRGTFCQNFLIAGISVHDCRRNGIAVVAGRSGRIEGCKISRINGTPPRAGIDLEPDEGQFPNKGMTIKGIEITDADIGVAVTIANIDVAITNSKITGGNSGIMIGDGTRGLRVLNNLRIASLNGNSEGGAIRTAAHDTRTINDVLIENNDLEGGGFFVVDFSVAGYNNLIINYNRISASNKGARIARLLSGGSFIGNDCTVTRGAGSKDGFFVQLHNVRHGRNRYQSDSRFLMSRLISGGRDVGGNIYASTALR